MSDRPRNPGAAPVDYVNQAIAIILTSDIPVSTRELKDKLGLSEHETIGLRRGLRTAEEQGQIQVVVAGPDRSLTWLPKEVSVERCAGHAANLYLQREKAKTQVDPNAFEQWLHETNLQT